MGARGVADGAFDRGRAAVADRIPPWSGLRKDWIAGTLGTGLLVGLVYALALVG